jgi:hypothetical protein
MKKIIQAEALPHYRLRLRYDDGIEGIVDLSNEVGKEFFAAWKDPKHFVAVNIDRGGRALRWPGEIDLCADALYLEITGMKPEELFPALQSEGTHA